MTNLDQVFNGNIRYFHLTFLTFFWGSKVQVKINGFTAAYVIFVGVSDPHFHLTSTSIFRRFLQITQQHVSQSPSGGPSKKFGNR